MQIHGRFCINYQVDDKAKEEGQDFIVTVSLLNQAYEDITISYYYSPLLPHIERFGIHILRLKNY